MTPEKTIIGIMNIKDYQKKIHDLLAPITKGKKLPLHNKSAMENLIYLIKTSSLLLNGQRNLHRTKALPPQLYGLPKIDKNRFHYVQLLAPSTPPHIMLRNTWQLSCNHILDKHIHISEIHFTEKLKTFSLWSGPNDRQISFATSNGIMYCMNGKFPHGKKWKNMHLDMASLKQSPWFW